MQNKKKLTSKSQENEFGDKNNLETGPKYFFQTFQTSVRYHACLSLYVKLAKANDTTSRK